MELALVIALVSATVSILGVTANVYVARRAREAAKAQLAFSALVKESETLLGAVRTYASKTERYRIACWYCLDAVLARHTRENAENNVSVACDELRKAYREFFESWAETKADLPAPYKEPIQNLRHRIRRMTGELFGLFDEVHHTGGTLVIALSDRQVERELDDRLHNILTSLAQLFDFLVSMKNDIVADLFLGKELDSRGMATLHVPVDLLSKPLRLKSLRQRPFSMTPED